MGYMDLVRTARDIIDLLTKQTEEQSHRVDLFRTNDLTIHEVGVDVNFDS